MKGCRPLTIEEQKEIRASFYGRHATRNKTLFLLGIHSGFRISELLSIRVKDVWNGSGPRESVQVRRSNMKAKKNGRTVPLNSVAKRAISEYMVEYQLEADRPLFPSQVKPDQPFNRQRAHAILSEVFSDCGLDGSTATHSLRKTFAWAVYKVTGGNIHAVKEMLGHANIATTVSYLGFSHEEAADIVDKIAELYE